MGNRDLPAPDFIRNMRLIGHSNGYAYIGHMFSMGFSVMDVRDPRSPVPVTYVAAPPNTWNIHLQTHETLLLVINAKDM